MADESFDGSTDDLISEIRKMEKEKEELEKKNKERQQLEQQLKQLKGNVSSLKSGKNSSSQSSSQKTGDHLSSETVLNTSFQDSQARLRSLQDSLLSQSPLASTSFRRVEDSNRSFEGPEDDVMTPQHKHALRENRDVLVENMTPDDIFNDLISKHILSNADVSRIKEKNTIEAVNEELLNVLIRRSDRAFSVFVSSLRRTLQGWLANRLEPDMSNKTKRKRRTGELNVDVECADLMPQSKKRYTCTCREVEEQILEMAKVAFLYIRRRDRTSASFEQFKKELSQTNEAIKDSMEILHSLKTLCRHGDVVDLCEGSVRFIVRCSSFASCRRLWEDYKSGIMLEAFEKSVITPSLLKICAVKKVFIRVKISRLEYLTCALELCQKQQVLRIYPPLKKDMVASKKLRRVRGQRTKLGRQDKHKMVENSPICSDQGRLSTRQPQRILREISPNKLNPVGLYKESSCLGHSREQTSKVQFCSAQTYLGNVDYNYSLKENLKNSPKVAGAWLDKRDMSDILPFTSKDTHFIQHLQWLNHSPVYKTRSKTPSGKGVNSENVNKLLIRKQLQYSVGNRYNLRYRTIKT